MNAIHHVVLDATFAASAASETVQSFSKFDVLETGFWNEQYAKAKNLATVQEVLDTMEIITYEPCYDSDRVVMMVETAVRIAKRTLSLH